MAKKGFSKDHEKFIHDHLRDMPPEKIASTLGLPLRKVKRRIDELKSEAVPKGVQAGEPAERAPIEAPAVGALWRKIVFVALICVIAAGTFLVYSPALNNDFIWDDEYLILNNSYIRSFSHVKGIFVHYLGYASGNVNNFYRPLQELTYFFDYALWKQNPKGYHLVNIVLHAGCAVLVYVFAFLLTRSMTVSFLAGFVFGIHPVNTEAVVYIAGRADPLYLLFFLAALICYLAWAFLTQPRPGGTGVRSTRKLMGHGALCASVLFFAMSVLSKEVALILPLLILLIQKVFFRGRLRTDAAFRFSSGPFFFVLLAYGFFRTQVLNFPAVQSDIGQIPTALRLSTAVKAIPTYFRLLILPTDLHMERRLRIARGLFEPEPFLSVLFIAGLLAVAFYMMARRKEECVPFGIFWFFINILPVSNIVPINSFVAEHWIYAASIGIYMLAAQKLVGLASRAKGKLGYGTKASFAVLCGLFFAFLMATTISACKNWKDEISFFESNLKYSPNNLKLHLNLGNTYYEKGMLDKALEEYNKAIAISPKCHEAYGNIGAVCIDKKKFDEAEKYYKKAISIKEDVHIFHYALGDIYETKGNSEGAIKEYKRCAEILPAFYSAYNKIAYLLMRQGSKKDAAAYLAKSLSINPNQPEIRNTLEGIK